LRGCVGDHVRRAVHTRDLFHRCEQFITFTHMLRLVLTVTEFNVKTSTQTGRTPRHTQHVTSIASSSTSLLM
jgi:hypothetical protein